MAIASSISVCEVDCESFDKLFRDDFFAVNGKLEFCQTFVIYSIANSEFLNMH